MGHTLAFSGATIISNNNNKGIVSNDDNAIIVPSLSPSLSQENFMAASSTNMTMSENKSLPFSSMWKYPVAPLVTHNNGSRVIALLSMGPDAAKSTLVERILVSIRRSHVGQFSGLVWLLTDAPPERYANLTLRDENFIVMHPREEDWNWETPQDMPYKRFKTYFLPYLDRDDRLASVEFVYYLDIDIVVGKPLQPWFDHVENTHIIKSNSSSSQMVFFKGNNHWPFQGGQFILQRNHSEYCMLRWRYHIDSNVLAHKDQKALKKLYKEEKKNASQNHSKCHLTAMPQEPYLRFLDGEVMQRMYQSKNYTTMMHIKNTEQADMIPYDVQKQFFASLLELTPDESEAVTAKGQILPNHTWSAEIVQGSAENTTKTS